METGMQMLGKVRWLPGTLSVHSYIGGHPEHPTLYYSIWLLSVPVCAFIREDPSSSSTNANPIWDTTVQVKVVVQCPSATLMHNNLHNHAERMIPSDLPTAEGANHGLSLQVFIDTTGQICNYISRVQQGTIKAHCLETHSKTPQALIY
jgi:hypothetical protein